MLRYIVTRILWMVPTLVGISFLTFLFLDLAPADRAQLEVAAGADLNEQQRVSAVLALRKRYGQVDPDTGEPYTVWNRYANWVGHASRLDFSPEDETAAQFRRRFVSALLVSALIGSLAIAVCLGVGIPLGGWIGMRQGGLLDRAASGVLLFGYALPEFLVATLLIFGFGGVLFGEALLPSSGLRSPAAASWSWPRQFLDLGAHLILPVATLSIAPTAVVVRHVRESVARVAASDFVTALRGFGMSPATIRKRVLRNAMTTTVTRATVIVPALLMGSVVVEQVFALPGLGRMGFQAVVHRDVSTVMAVTVFSAILVLVALLVGDIVQRRLDPRVVLR